jgi:hypothetical protein
VGALRRTQEGARGCDSSYEHLAPAGYGWRGVSLARHSYRVSGNYLPNILGILTVLATLVVIWFAWQTVKEARKATTEERNAVGELQALVTKVGDLSRSTAQLVEATRRTAELTAEARDNDQGRSRVGQLREMLALVDQIESELDRVNLDEFKATGAIAEHSDRQWWQQFELKGMVEKGVDGIELPACRRLAAARGAATVTIAATDASIELQKALRGLGVRSRL